MTYSMFKSGLFSKKRLPNETTSKISSQTETANNDATEVSTKILLAQVQLAKNLDLKTIKNTKTFAAGLHQSKFRGRGMDYQESRIYQPGDDVRSMDWKITARTDKVYTKLFQEEKQRPTFIIVDTNQSMRFGTKTQFKSVLAAKLAALLGWVTINSGDKVGGMTFGINGTQSQKPQSGKAGMMKWMMHLVEANKINYTANNSKQKNSNDLKKQQNQQHNSANVNNTNTNNTNIQICNLDETLKKLRGLCSPGSLIIIISDFYQLGDNAKQQLSLLSKNNDILALFICDTFELCQPNPAQYEVYQRSQNMLQSQVIDMRNKQVQQQFINFQQQHLQNIKATMLSLNIAVLPVQTDDNIIQTLKRSMTNPHYAFEYWLKNLNNHE